MEYDIEKILYTFEDDYNPSSMVPGPRNMYNQGQLVQPSDDGSRPGYNGANKTSGFTEEQKKNIKTWEKNTGKKFSDLLKLTGKSASTKRSDIKRGTTKGTGVYTKGGEKLSLPKEMQSLYNQIKDERYDGKKFSELSGQKRANFKSTFKETQSAYNRTKNAITLEELQKLLTDEFGQDISINKIRGRFGKEGITDFAKEIEKLKVGTGLGGAEMYYKKPSKLALNRIANKLEFGGKNKLQKQTVSAMLKLNEKFGSMYRKGALPSMEEVIASDKFFKNMSHNTIGNATARLSQVYSGHKFKNSEFDNIRINTKAGEKMFELMSKARFGNPYYSGFYRTALQTIDEKLGNEKGTFESLKKEAVKILKKNKIPVYNINAKNPVGFNINEIAGVAGSSKSKAAEFSQFVDVMEGSLNQQEMASFQSELSRARQAIENNPSSLSSESKKINARAKSLEKTYGIELPRLKDPDATKYFSPKRLYELKAQGLDIVKAAERAGYTIQMPKGSKTIQEFTDPKNLDQVKKMLSDLGCPKSLQKASGGRIKYSNGTSCAIKGREVLEKGLKNGFKESDQTLARGILKSGRFLKDAVSLRGLFGPAALAFTAAAEAGIVGYDMLATGKSFREAVGDSVFNYALGDKTKIDSVEERDKRMVAEGMTPEQMGKIKYFESMMDDMQTGFKNYDVIKDLEKKIEDNTLNQQVPEFPDQAFQLNTQLDKAQADNQDYFRTDRVGELENYFTPKEDGTIPFVEGSDTLQEGLRRNELAQLQNAGTGKIYQSRLGDEKRSAKIRELMLQNPDIRNYMGSYPTNYGFMEGGIASLNVNKK